MVMIQEEALLSGLAFRGCDKHTKPKWNSSKWPPFLDGGRDDYASVVVDHAEKQHQTVVVIAGVDEADGTNCVCLLNVGEETKKWRKGPALNGPRTNHAAVVCNGGVYAIGGYNDRKKLDTIERIDVEDLLQVPSSNNSKKWTTLNCRLSTERDDSPGAAAVHNRFIVVAGGQNSAWEVLSSVDIIDTTMKDQHTVIAGPSLSVPRCFCGMAAIGSCLYVVGGGSNKKNELLDSVEYLEFTCSENASSLFPSTSSWTIHETLVLPEPLSVNAVAKVGKCMIVAGTEDNVLVQVLDTQRNVVWSLPTCGDGDDDYCTMVSTSRGIMAIAYDGTSTTIPLVSERDASIPVDVSNKLAPEISIPIDFYNMLVEIGDGDDEDIIFKVHDLALLISNVHELKIFCTFLNYLRRTSQVDNKDWQRYMLKALKEMAKTTDSMNHDDRTIFGLVINNCCRDKVKIDACRVQHPVSGSSSSKTWSSEVDFRKQLAKIDIRVGVIHPHSNGSPSLCREDRSDCNDHDFLDRCKKLGCSVKEMRKALEQQNYKTAAVAAICSVLNALSFDTVWHEDCGRHVVSQSALCQIVDFGDVTHICSIVDQIGDKLLQDACDVGRSIIQRASVSSVSDPSEQQGVDLVTALGLLANESKKLKESAGHDEAVTVLALVVTAALCCNQDGTLSILDMDSGPGPSSTSLLAHKSGTISTTPMVDGASTPFDDDSIRGANQVEERLSLQGQHESKLKH